MFVANDQAGKRITIEDAVPGGTYFFLFFGGALIVKAKESEAVKEHFAHKSRRQCDSWNYDMSEWHRTWQRFFPEECQEVVVQNGEEKHRADVLINNTVIEFQHSPIKAEEIADRNRFYISCGYNVVWVFDAEGKIKNEFEDTLDPCLCRETDLCWKRARREFTLEIPKDVTVYLHYRTSLGSLFPQNGEQAVDIMLRLKKVDSKQFTFFQTVYFDKMSNRIVGSPIMQPYFLKEYGVTLPSIENIPTVHEIMQGIERWRARQQQKIIKRKRPQQRIIVMPMQPWFMQNPNPAIGFAQKPRRRSYGRRRNPRRTK